ncbi:hypothetical protein M513_10743, partial [Trichuris suis]
ADGKICSPLLEDNFASKSWHGHAKCVKVWLRNAKEDKFNCPLCPEEDNCVRLQFLQELCLRGISSFCV